MNPARRTGPVTLMSMMLLATWGCTENPAESVENVLLGTWELSIVSESPMPEDKPMTLEIRLQDGGFFDAELITNCGLGGLFGFSSWSDDWREIKVTLGRSPRGATSGSLSTNCIKTVQPMSGYHIEALFGDEQMVGRITHQVNRGTKWVGPIYVATELFLFVGRKRRPIPFPHVSFIG